MDKEIVAQEKPAKQKKSRSGWAGATALMTKPAKGTKEDKERNTILATATALKISPFGVNILGELPYINKLGLVTKAREYDRNIQFLYEWVRIAEDDLQKAICKCTIVDAKGRKLADGIVGECSPSTIKMGTLKGYQNHMAQTRAKNRAILEAFGDRIHGDLVKGIQRLIESKTINETDAARIGGAASSSVEEIQQEDKAVRGATIKEQDAFLKLKLLVREYGAERGLEKEFIEQVLGRVIDWPSLEDKDIASIKTQLNSKLTPRE